MYQHSIPGGLILGREKIAWPIFTVFFQAVVWQKSKVSDHGAALVAVLGSSIAANLLPVRHRHEQAEVSDALGNGGKSAHTQQNFWVPQLSLLFLWT